MTQQVIPHPDAGSRKGKALETVAGITYADNFASITGYRVVARYDTQVTPHPGTENSTYSTYRVGPYIRIDVPRYGE